LPGFNHYPDCPCGWCVYYGRMSRSERRRLESDMRHRDAVNALKRESARSISGCYVNPNAKCPVCGVGVFFYANEHGSRVFFDDLGPPWPKHPCTDIPRDYVPKTRQPIRRTRGSMQELISAANVAGLFDNRVFGQRADDAWTMLVVLDAERTDDENSVTAEFLDSREGESTTFTCRSDIPILEAGDFINMKGDEISFVHKEALRPVTFLKGETVVVPDDTEASAPSPAPAETPETPKQRSPIPSFPKKQDYSREPLTEAEMVHFNSEAVGLGELFGKLEPVVKFYAREHTRKPVDVSLRLNAEGHRTAAGELWTSRLVRFLLALMFNDSPKPGGTSDARREVSRPRRAAAPGPTIVSMDDKDEIARRLSSLGRVTMKPKRL
jgi:hypothetical protein